MPLSALDRTLAVTAHIGRIDGLRKKLLKRASKIAEVLQEGEIDLYKQLVYGCKSLPHFISTPQFPQNLAEGISLVPQT